MHRPSESDFLKGDAMRAVMCSGWVVWCIAAIGISGCKPSPESPPADSQLTIAFVTNQIADFWKIAEAGCHQAAKELDVEVRVEMPSQATVVEQKRIVQDLLTSGIGGISISPLDAANQTDWLNEIAARVPLITQDSDAPQTTRRLYIGMDNYQAGRMCGKLVKQAIPAGGNVMLFIGRLEQDNSKYRLQGVIDELIGPADRDLQYYQDRPNAWSPFEEEIRGDRYTILGTITDQGKPEVAQTKAEDALNTYPQMSAMVGLFEYNPKACYQALQKAGKLGAIQLIGFDENEVTLNAIKEGHCQGTVVQNPFQYGYESVRVLTALLRGDESVIPETRFLNVAPRIVDQENVDAFRADLRALTEG